ncbi:SoxR reducing system RseC family protein [Shewanella sp. JM162201]|uniref:SoxR reducing system RseC family protein n=1 Tax=Shewanella jiangmenensis TaxID=2837387 RepID=A0ABS5V211_9GAMM|nr:SoxR reducing system RseC family protein [Shewanella jiangmenensis]MBT1444502.1 SoxR reducing system RseC family protein [Shewanella jiangmenensis]
MMEELARVVKVEPSGWVTVEVEVKTACGHCSAKENCGTGAIASAFAGKTQQFSIHSSERCEEGELLRLGLPESSLLKAAALVYLMPLAGMLLGALFGKLMAVQLNLASVLGLGADSASILFALVGGVISWRFGKHLARALERETVPVILARLGKSITPDCLTKPA